MSCSKITLTLEESQDLISLGFLKEFASQSQVTKRGEAIKVPGGMLYKRDETAPIFTLYDLIRHIPETCEEYDTCYHFRMEASGLYWEVGYFVYGVCLRGEMGNGHRAPELIDAIYEFLKWCLINKYIDYGKVQKETSSD